MAKTRASKVFYIYRGKKYKHLKDIVKITGKTNDTIRKWFRRGSDAEGNICRRITEPF